MKRILVVSAALLVLALPSGAAEPDNSAVNARDADDKTLTVFDQSESAEDVKISAAVRELVVADDSLSMNAHNVKIITISGVVTLRGPVESTAEKASIGSKAKSVAGVKRVDNQVDAKAK